MKRRSRRRQKRRTLNLIIITLIFLICVYFTPKLFTAARYIYNKINENYLSSKDFYFSSDKLTKDNAEYIITNNWSGASTYTVTINMSSKKNDKVFTEADIDYEISYTCSSNITCTLNKEQGTIVGTKNGGICADWFSININPSGGQALNSGETAWVEIQATSTSPYEDTIRGKLILETGTADIYYEIVDSENSPYLMLNITNTTGTEADVTLQYNPQNVLLDMTSRFYLNSTDKRTEEIDNYAYINRITSQVGLLGVTSVKFYKTNPSIDYSYLRGDNITPVITLSY